MSAAADLYPSLKDRVVVMTGGGRGLGLEMALALVEAGARVTVTGAREASELADARAQAEALAGPDGHKRPPLIGLYTNQIVYERLAHGVLAELQRLNPTVSPGYRRNKHHQ